MSRIVAADARGITAAVDALRRGEVVGLPTETVYGLAADATNDDALRRVFAVKGRPATHPLIVHIADVSQLDDLASEVSDAGRRPSTAAPQASQTTSVARTTGVSPPTRSM